MYWFQHIHSQTLTVLLHEIVTEAVMGGLGKWLGNDTVVTLTCVGDFPIGDDLIYKDAEWPHIWFDGERTIVYSFWCSPLDGEFSTWIKENISE